MTDSHTRRVKGVPVCWPLGSGINSTPVLDLASSGCHAMVYTKTANGPADYLLAAAPGSLDGLEEAMRWWRRNHSGITEGFANALLNPVDLLARRSAVTTSEA